MPNENENVSVNERINNFIRQNRTMVLGLLAFIVVVFVGFIIAYSVLGALQNRANAAIEELAVRYETLRPEISADASDAVNDEIAVFVHDLEAFAGTASAYAGGKAYGILADIYQRQQRFEDAQAAWVSAAQKAKKTYLEPVSWYNAAGTAENLGNYENAIEYYAKSIGAQANFPLAVQSQFSIGRLKEEAGDIDGAIEAYRALISGWADDAVWPNLARSRIVALETLK